MIQYAESDKYNTISDEIADKYDLRCLLRNAFLIRLIVLIIILVVGGRIGEVYFISDDVAYEELAKAYLERADRFFDLDALQAIGATGYLQILWPYIMCLLAYIFKTIYAARFLNIVLSTIAVKLIYDLTLCLSDNHWTALKAAKLYAYLPYPVMVCCFPIKDIYLTVAILYAFILFVRFQQRQTIKVVQVVLTVVLLVGAYFTRGAVAEIMMLFFAVFLLKRFADERNYGAFGFCIFLSLIFLYFYGPSIIDSFSTKVDDYGGYAQMDTTISAIQMSNITQIYKLPFTYFFATLQPIALNLFSATGSKIWSQLMSYGNLLIVPIACGNFLYIFHKKKNMLFWICSTVMYCAVATLSLGIYRHYLFLLPIEMINFSLYREEESELRSNNLLVFTVACYLLIVLYSVYSAF